MKSASEWKFSAARANVDLARIVAEAAESEALGVIRIQVNNEWAVLSAIENTRKFGLPRPHGYLTNLSRVERVCGHLSIGELENPFSDAPQNAIAVFLCASQNEADALVGKLTDRVVVNVEVF